MLAAELGGGEEGGIVEFTRVMELWATGVTGGQTRGHRSSPGLLPGSLVLVRVAIMVTTVVPVGVVALWRVSRGSGVVRVLGVTVEPLAGGQVGGGPEGRPAWGAVLSALPGEGLELRHGEDLGRGGRPLQGRLGLLVPVLEGLGTLRVGLERHLGERGPVGQWRGVTLGMLGGGQGHRYLGEVLGWLGLGR